MKTHMRYRVRIETVCKNGSVVIPRNAIDMKTKIDGDYMTISWIEPLGAVSLFGKDDVDEEE